jgi:hypothetical protein
MEFFLQCLGKVPATYFGPHDRGSADYGDEYTAVIHVKQWLRLIAEARLLSQAER